MTLESNGEIHPRRPKDGDAFHYPGCWKQHGHHGCAVAEIERLTRLVAKLERSNASDDVD